MRLIAVPSGLARYNREILTRDVIMVPELFCKPADLAIYDKVNKRRGHELFTEISGEQMIEIYVSFDLRLIGSDQDPDWIRIQSRQWIRIRIPDPGGQNP
jgi:hypothetical protein